MILTTRNPDDVEAPHRQPDHPGISAIYLGNDPRDRSCAGIAQAIANIVAAAVPIAGTFHTPNRWRSGSIVGVGTLWHLPAISSPGKPAAPTPSV